MLRLIMLLCMLVLRCVCDVIRMVVGMLLVCAVTVVDYAVVADCVPVAYVVYDVAAGCDVDVAVAGYVAYAVVVDASDCGVAADVVMLLLASMHMMLFLSCMC